MKQKSGQVIAFIFILAVIGLFAFSYLEVKYLDRAHSTFEDYYAFRGCTQLLERTADYGICRTTGGDTIKIVKFKNKWFLDGDLPCGFFCW